MKAATMTSTIQHLRQLFARFGIPVTIVTDNGTQFTSSEFSQFCSLNGIHHVKTAPYHPASNGLAERAVRIFKEGVWKFVNGTVSDRIARLLFQYRSTPHTTTGMSPAELLLGRKLRTRLDSIRPDVRQRVAARQLKQKLHCDAHARDRYLQEGDTVFMKNYWCRGEVATRNHFVTDRTNEFQNQAHRRKSVSSTH